MIVDAALALAETQLLAQVADDASLDGRATGLIGFNGALLAAAIAAKELLKLGPLWPSPFVVLFMTTGMLLYVFMGDGTVATSRMTAPQRRALPAAQRKRITGAQDRTESERHSAYARASFSKRTPKDRR